MRRLSVPDQLGAWCGVLVVIAAALPARGAAVKQVYTIAEAHAGGTVDSSPLHVDPDHAEGSAAVSVTTGGNPTPDYFTQAQAVADFGGPFRASAALGGTASAASPDKSFWALSSASQSNDYRVDSDTLPFGSAVQGTLTLHYSGAMSLTHAAGATFGPFELWAEVNTLVELTGTGTSYKGDATLDANGGLQESDNFQSAFRFTDDGAGRKTATLDMTQAVTFQTTAGATFQFQFDLVTYAEADELDGMSAESDFFEGSTFALAASNGARFTVLPEPASPALAMGIGAAALRRRRRR